MEHFYERIDGYMSRRNTVMLDLAIERFPGGGTWVELGSWTGKSAAYCVVSLINTGKLGPFYCVDSWQGGPEHHDNELIVNRSLKQTFETNVAPVMDRITAIEGISWEAADRFKDGTVDFCYVDAGHTYDCVTRDLTAWWPKIRPGALFGGDDYTKGWPEVCRAVEDFFGPKSIKVSKSGRCWLVTKPLDTA